MRIVLFYLVIYLANIILFAEPIKVACIGNSITYGSVIGGPAVAYPAKLGVKLGSEFDVRNFGKPGATIKTTTKSVGLTPYLHTEEFNMMQDFKPDIAIVMLGINDHYDPLETWDKDKFYRNYIFFIDSLIKMLPPNSQIYLCYVTPDWNELERGVRIIENDINPAIDKVSLLKALPVISNTYTILTSKDFFTSDGVHPNAQGALKLAEAIYDALQIELFNITITQPLEGIKISGKSTIEWIPSFIAQSATTIIHFSNDDGKNWKELVTLTASDSSYVWETDNEPDGPLYRLAIEIKNDSQYAIASTQRFSIDEPGINGAPAIFLLSSNFDGVLTGEKPIHWYAIDPDEGDYLSIDCAYSLNSGTTWQTLFKSNETEGTHLWNSVEFANGPNYMLRLICSDALLAQDIVYSEQFKLENMRSSVSSSNIIHKSGSGGHIIANIVDSVQIKNHLYRVIFNIISDTQRFYNVEDVNSGEILVVNNPIMDDMTEGPVFDGLRLIVKDYSEIEPNLYRSGWIKGNPTIGFSASVFVSGTIVGTAYPADYTLTFYDNVVDTSIEYYTLKEKEMKFIVTNITENKIVDIAFPDNDNNHTISNKDLIIIFEKISPLELQPTWRIDFFSTVDSNMVYPASGDEFLFAIGTPISEEDIYEIQITSVSADDKYVELPSKYYLYQNYPNPFNPRTTIRYTLPEESQVSIKIYNALGQEIKTLVNEKQAAGDNSVVWNANKCVSGVYIVKMSAGGFSQANKMLLMK